MLKVKPCREAKAIVQTLAPSPIHRPVACARRPGCCPCVLPWPCVHEAAAIALRGILASGHGSVHWQTHHCVLEGTYIFSHILIEILLVRTSPLSPASSRLLTP